MTNIRERFTGVNTYGFILFFYFCVKRKLFPFSSLAGWLNLNFIFTFVWRGEWNSYNLLLGHISGRKSQMKTDRRMSLEYCFHESVPNLSACKFKDNFFIYLWNNGVRFKIFLVEKYQTFYCILHVYQPLFIITEKWKKNSSFPNKIFLILHPIESLLPFLYLLQLNEILISTYWTRKEKKIDQNVY